MKKILLCALLITGCASTSPNSAPPPPFTEPRLTPLSCPAQPTCSDQIVLMTEDDLKKGATCPSNSRLIFPSAFLPPGKVLVMCQCK